MSTKLITRGLRAVLLGAPGVGKGTYGQRVAEALQLPFVSAGDVLRDEVRSGSKVGQAVEAAMKAGLLVPDSLVWASVEGRLQALGVGQGDERGKGYILDGFPRRLEQAEQLDSASVNGSSLAPQLALHIHMPTHLLERKICARRSCLQCGRTYNLADFRPDGLDLPPLLPTRPGLCDRCGESAGPLVIRPDDQPDIVAMRLKQYNALASPLLGYYAASSSAAASKMNDAKQDSCGEVEYPRSIHRVGRRIDIPVVGPPQPMVRAILDFLESETL